MIPPQSTPASFQPYGFLLRPQQQRRGSNPPSPTHPQQDAAYEPRLLAETEHGAYLGHACDFIVPPEITPTDPAELPASSRCLFIGHLRFETTTADVRWIVKKLTDVNPLRADIRGNGCCVVYLASEADANAVRLLSRRILFDRHGFWFARTGDAVDIMMDYVEKVLPGLGCTGAKRRSLRLPRDAIVVEDSRSSKSNRRSNKSAASTTAASTSPSKHHASCGLVSPQLHHHAMIRYTTEEPRHQHHTSSTMGAGGFHDDSDLPDYVQPQQPVAVLGYSNAAPRTPVF